MYVGGFTVPYDISIALLCIGFALIALLWKENYGDGHKPGCLAGFACGILPDPTGGTRVWNWNRSQQIALYKLGKIYP